jgi:hypothetical protein
MAAVIHSYSQFIITLTLTFTARGLSHTDGQIKNVEAEIKSKEKEDEGE